MKVIAINGSPRKEWNTATLLKKALEGAASQGAETELFHLYDFNYKGCISCFACKTKDGKSYGKCVVKDEITPILEKISKVDAIIFGSPIYFGSITGEMKSFLERVLFPYTPYGGAKPTLFPKKINSGLIYTMNVTEAQMKQMRFDKHLFTYEFMVRMVLGSSETLYSNDTYQFDDYSKMVADRFDLEKKAKQREEVFPIDCEKAYDMGIRFAKKS